MPHIYCTSSLCPAKHQKRREDMAKACKNSIAHIMHSLLALLAHLSPGEVLTARNPPHNIYQLLQACQLQCPVSQLAVPLRLIQKSPDREAERTCMN